MLTPSPERSSDDDELEQKQTPDLHFNSFRWVEFEENVKESYQQLREKKLFYDITISCENSEVEAHKIVLIASSDFFRRLLERISIRNNPHPIIFIKDVKMKHFKFLLEFMYSGEVKVPQNDTKSVLQAAKDLQVEGLQIIDFDDYNHIETGNKKRHISSDSSTGLSFSIKRIRTDIADSINHTLSSSGNLSPVRIKSEIKLEESNFVEVDTQENDEEENIGDYKLNDDWERNTEDDTKKDEDDRKRKTEDDTKMDEDDRKTNTEDTKNGEDDTKKDEDDRKTNIEDTKKDEDDRKKDTEDDTKKDEADRKNEAEDDTKKDEADRKRDTEDDTKKDEDDRKNEAEDDTKKDEDDRKTNTEDDTKDDTKDDKLGNVKQSLQDSSELCISIIDSMIVKAVSPPPSSNEKMSRESQRAALVEKVASNLFKCKLCEYTSKTSFNVKKHAEGHLSPRKYKCHLCPSVVKNEAYFKGHMKTKHDIKMKL